VPAGDLVAGFVGSADGEARGPDLPVGCGDLLDDDVVADGVVGLAGEGAAVEHLGLGIAAEVSDELDLGGALVRHGLLSFC
jgi:hypothetical protein